MTWHVDARRERALEVGIGERPVAPGAFTRTSVDAPAWPATHAAMLSLVTSHECGSGSALRSQRDGASTGHAPGGERRCAPRERLARGSRAAASRRSASAY